MYRHHVAGLIICLLSIPGILLASQPDFVNYSGRLSDGQGAGQSLAMDLTLRLYDEEGSGLWEQAYPGTWLVDGYFSLVLGEGIIPGTDSPISVVDVFGSMDRTWLGVCIGADCTPFQDLQPRQPIGSVPYAVRANAISDGAVAPSKVSPGWGLVPAGAIIMWSGAVDDIPEGWALCDGNDGTPDLRSRFIVGAGSDYEPGDWGGDVSSAHTHTTGNHTLTIGQLPEHAHGASTNHTGGHSHGGSTNNKGNHSHGLATNLDAGGDILACQVSANDYHNPGSGAYTGTSGSHSHSLNINNAGGHSHTVNIQNTGSNQAHNHGPTGPTSNTENRPPFYALAYIIKQ